MRAAKTTYHARRRGAANPLCGALLVAAVCLLASGCTQEELWGDPDDDSDSGIIVIPPPGEDVDEDIIYGVNDTSDNLFEVDPSTGAITFIGALNPDTRIFTTPSAVAVRESDGSVFVWNNRDPLDPPGPAGRLLTADVCSGFALPVDVETPGQGEMRGLAFIQSTLYGVGPSADGADSDALWIISAETGVAERVDPDETFVPLGGLDGDSSDGSLLGIELGGEPGRTAPLRVLRLDPDAGTATAIATLDASITRGDAILELGDDVFAGGLNNNQQPVFFSLDPSTGRIIEIFQAIETIQGMGLGPACDE